MTQEEKQLLLQDLCARLPYGVIVRHADCIVDGEGNETGKFHYTKGYLYDVCREDDMTTTIIESEGENEGYNHICLLEWTIPYLRPMPGMTEEEQKEFVEFHCVTLCPIIMDSCLTIENEGNMFDWLNAHHFDYRGLIEKGLALEAPEGIYE